MRKIATSMVGMDHVTFQLFTDGLDDQLILLTDLTHKHQSLLPWTRLVHVASMSIASKENIHPTP